VIVEDGDCRIQVSQPIGLAIYKVKRMVDDSHFPPKQPKKKASAKKYTATPLSPLPSLPEPVISTPEQGSLFSVAEQRAIYLAGYAAQQQNRPTELTMTAATLQAWKQRVFNYQQQVRIPAQPNLLDLLTNATPNPAGMGPSPSSPAPLEPNPLDPNQLDLDQLDPFSLLHQNIEFWRWQPQTEGEAALYFVIDHTLPLLLYVGETVQSHKRWQGEHGCKEYLAQYRDLHYQHEITTHLGIAFWRQAPKRTRLRQKLESALIYKWRSPFNKENWRYWGTPFVQ
jgi:hypothetical protein